MAGGELEVGSLFFPGLCHVSLTAVRVCVVKELLSPATDRWSLTIEDLSFRTHSPGSRRSALLKGLPLEW